MLGRHLVLDDDQKALLLERLHRLIAEIEEAGVPQSMCRAAVPVKVEPCLRHKGHTGPHSAAMGEFGNGDEPDDVIPKPVLEEAKRLLDWHMSDESNPDQDTALALTSFKVHRDEFHGTDLYVISATTVELHGPLAEVTGQHDTLEQLRPDGTLVGLWEDGVRR